MHIDRSGHRRLARKVLYSLRWGEFDPGILVQTGGTVTLSLIGKDGTSVTAPAAEAQTVQRLLEQATGQPFIGGNHVRVLQNGSEIFPPMLDAIRRAEHRIDFATYVYWTGDIARAFATALSARARSGVRVRVLLDSFGAKRMRSQLLEQMTRAGVQIRWFRPLSKLRPWRNDKRTHRKLLICDDTVGFTGGVGIADEWKGNARNPSEWRDTHVAIRGPAINGLRAAFVDNWNEAGEWEFDERVARPAARAGNIPVQVVRASTTIGWTDTANLLRGLISISKRQLRLVTAYFNPDKTLVEQLLAANRRGVDIRILVPGPHCDSRLSQLAGFESMQRLMAAGIRVWMYQRTMLHAKVITVDSNVAMIGSANLNFRSMNKDEECCVVMLSGDIAQELDDRFDDDCRDAEEQLADDWKSRSRFLRLQERCARLIKEQV
jgi:cardiolipin synthase